MHYLSELAYVVGEFARRRVDRYSSQSSLSYYHHFPFFIR